MNITTRFLAGTAAVLMAAQSVSAATPTNQISQPMNSGPVPEDVIDLLAQPEQIAPGVQYRLPNKAESFTIQGSGQKKFDQQQQLATGLELAKRAGIKIPRNVTGPEPQVINAIKLTGQASTYGIGDGLYGAPTSSGRPAVEGVAALEIDLAHVLSDKGALPYSMAGVKAQVRFPSGKTVTKNLVDKGGLHNPINKSGWEQKIQQAKVNEAGVADLGTVPYRVIDIVGPVNLYPKVEVTVPLKKPLTIKSQIPASQALQRLSAWAKSQQQAPAPLLDKQL